jgi:hypothetical protein
MPIPNATTRTRVLVLIRFLICERHGTPFEHNALRST